MIATLREPARNLPVTGAFDVVVAGGGIGGVAAAVAAARTGVSVCLLEKECSLGGLATVGNVTVWLPICAGPRCCRPWPRIPPTRMPSPSLMDRSTGHSPHVPSTTPTGRADERRHAQRTVGRGGMGPTD